MNNSAIVHAVFLRASHGIVVFKLGPPEAGGGKKAAARRAGGEGGPRAGGGPQPIAGEMVLRKGYYIAPDDVRMKLEGLYDAATGALNLTATHHDLYAHLGDQGEIIKRPFKEKEGVEYRQDLPWETGKPSFLGFGDSSAGPDMLRKCDVKLTLQATSNAEVRRQIANGTFYGPQEENFGAVPFQLGHESIQYLKLAGAVESETCDWKLHLNGTSLKLEQYTVKLTNYSLVVSTLCVLQVLFIVKQIEYSASQAAALKVSLASIGQQAVIDAYICLVHLSASVAVDALFNAFATVALFKFIVFSIFEMRYLLGLWRIRRASEDTDLHGPSPPSCVEAVSGCPRGLMIMTVGGWDLRPGATPPPLLLPAARMVSDRSTDGVGSEHASPRRSAAANSTSPGAGSAGRMQRQRPFSEPRRAGPHGP